MQSSVLANPAIADGLPVGTRSGEGPWPLIPRRKLTRSQRWASVRVVPEPGMPPGRPSRIHVYRSESLWLARRPEIRLDGGTSVVPASGPSPRYSAPWQRAHVAS